MWSSMWDASSVSALREALTIFLIIMAPVSFWFLWTWNKHLRNPKQAPLPPGPHGVPLLGYLPFLGTNLHHQFTDLSRVYGPIYKLQLGTKLGIVVSSPSLVKEVVRDQDTIFAYRDLTVAARILSYGGSDIVFGTYGSDWRRMRKMLVSQMLSKTNLDGCYALRKEEVVKSISHIFIGTPIDLGKFAFSTTINIIMRMLWGGTLQGEERSDDVGSEFRKVVEEMVELLEKPNISDFFPALSRFDLQGIGSRAKKLLSVMENIFDSAIEAQMNKAQNERVPENEEKGFLQFLLENNNDQDSATSLTLQQMKALLMDIVVGGTDTTAITVEWTMSELLQNPDEMKKVQEELTEIVGMNNLVEDFHLPKLRYLDAVIKETSRLHPAATLLPPRCPGQSTTVGGYHIPKGSRVFLNVWSIHRDPSVWDNPLEFRPGRFLNTDPNNSFDYLGNKFQYLPFGSGRRICAGIPLAERMLICVLASLLHSFEWRLPEDTKVDLSDRFGFVTTKLTPLIAIPTARLSEIEAL
ncbi:PREDICTED: geraniol 8-hydroxylase-like [Fragaria vesca subsp. vesca]